MKITREEIIRQTVNYAEEHGWNETSIRQISKRIKYSTIKIYSEFGSKEDLLLEIQANGFKQLKETYQKAINSAELPETQLLKISLAHYGFALKSQKLYELMFDAQESHCKSINMEVIAETAKPVKEVIKLISSTADDIHFLHWFSLISGFYFVTKNNFSNNEKDANKILETIIVGFTRSIK